MKMTRWPGGGGGWSFRTRERLRWKGHELPAAGEGRRRPEALVGGIDPSAERRAPQKKKRALLWALLGFFKPSTVSAQRWNKSTFCPLSLRRVYVISLTI
uniref:Uncharacterized protein n=1 Tax=Oryza sativa subsp. japonica TaxID=39947 RepID=Q6YV00_ORYSJ|nr:hypothetical protein [Oryza sativa Japonica Group]BAD25055.1 hypothetical protein [Oryza sativa Japonica Group]